ncbi:MAG: nuclear transport factor 2 family protein [Pyrinomonadaceae bacterium]
MNKFALTFVIILITGLAISGQKPAATDADEKAVRERFEDLIRGIENSSVDGVTDVYWKSENTLYFNNNGTVTRGWEQDRKNREARYPKASKVKLEINDLRVTMLGSTGALVTCLWKQSQDFDSQAEAATGRMTLVFKKFGKDWKIIHLHTSPDRPDPSRIAPSERERIEDSKQ